LNLLAGNLPGDIARGKPLESFRPAARTSRRMPSSLIDRRPDIRAAEQI